MMGSNEKNKNSISIEQKHVQTIINFLKSATPPVNALNIALEQQGHHERVDEKSKSVYVSL